MSEIKRFLRKKISINFVFFGLFFLFISGLHIYHIAIMEKGNVTLKSLFWGLAAAESLLETMFFVLVHHILQTLGFKKAAFVFLGCVITIGLIHFIDFPLTRIMDLNFWYALQLVMQESSKNFFEMLYATHIPMRLWVLGGLGFLACIGIGLLFYLITQSKAISLRFSYKQFFFVFIATLAFWKVGPILGLNGAKSYAFQHLSQALPWKQLAFSYQPPELNLAGGIAQPRSEKEVQEILETNRYFLPKYRPDIFLFVAESIREDFITPEIAPYLADFKEQNIMADTSLSSANGTQVSWFSIFFAQFPFYFQKINPANWSSGSPALQLFKKMGYKTYVFSSSRLAYYQMQEVIFGKDNHLAEKISLNLCGENKTAAECDRATIAGLLKLMDEQPAGGRLFIVFLESTHFGYSWPEEKKFKFSPISPGINFLNIALSKKEVEKVKNRYRNAMHFIDGLFGKFLNKLKENNLESRAVVIFTGDHGEEFYEEGHLFHASNLSRAQTEVPIYYQFGANNYLPKQSWAQMSSHIDIFPTLVHYLVRDEFAFSELFHGQSIFAEKRWPFVVVARYNASRTPYEFMLNNGFEKWLLRFENPINIFLSKKLSLIAIKDQNDRDLGYDNLDPSFQKAFQRFTEK